MARSLVTQLMFQNNDAEEAITLYVSLFPDSRIDEIARYDAQGPGKAGSVIRARFTVAGQALACIDSPAQRVSRRRRRCSSNARIWPSWNTPGPCSLTAAPR